MKVGKKQVDRTWRPDRSSLHHPFGDMVWPTCWRFLHGLLRWCKQNFVLGEKRSLPDSLPANNRGSHGPIRATHSLARALTRYLAGGCIYHDHRKVALKSVQLTRFLIVCLTRSTRFFKMKFRQSFIDGAIVAHGGITGSSIWIIFVVKWSSRCD